MPSIDKKKVKEKPQPAWQDAEAAEAGIPRLNMPQCRVFLVDDNADDRAETLRTLKSSPWIRHVMTFASADKLREHLAEKGYFSNRRADDDPVLLLLDIYLPGTTGIELLSEMKANPGTAYIPVVILTGLSSKEVARAAENLHANAYVTKPVKLEDIHEVIATGSGWPADGNKR